MSNIIKCIYDDAILIQNASNHRGVLNSIKRWMDDDEAAPSHNNPAIVLMDAQLISLGEKGYFNDVVSTEAWGNNYAICEERSVEYELRGDGLAYKKHDAEFRVSIWKMLTAWNAYIRESTMKNYNEFTSFRAQVQTIWLEWQPCDAVNPTIVGDEWDVYALRQLSSRPQIVIVKRDVEPSWLDGVAYFYACYGNGGDDSITDHPYVETFEDDQGYNDEARAIPTVADAILPPFRNRNAAIEAAENYAAVQQQKALEENVE